jgi:predicted DNA-binding protein (MmcQ/YjbR family)
MARTKRASGAFAAAEAALRAHALAKPEATEHFPWGERAIKVKGKVFLFMYADASKLSLSTKLPASNGVALMLPFAAPTGYGLGKAGWVSASFDAGAEPPVDMLCAWIDESYQAVAPAKLAAAARDPASASPDASDGKTGGRGAAPAAKAKAKAKAKATAVPRRTTPSAKRTAAKRTAGASAKRSARPTHR